jgi:glyoxylase-like metal-dependent hydrolase (beta-lactamase superfamily II)
VSLPAIAQDDGGYEITPLNDHLYKLSIDGGGYTVKVLASVGEDGLLLLETGQDESAEPLKAALQTLTDAAPKIIINSHEHVEHLAGNAAFGNDPLIIGHTILKTRLRSGSFLFDEFPDATLPDITFSDSLSIFFNGEEIKLIAFPGGHSDNDIIIWFTGSKVVFVGAISNGTHFPSVDEGSGDVLLYAPIAKTVIDLLPEDVTIIPGHGADGTMAEFRAFHDMLVKTAAVVKSGLDAGKDLEALQTEDVLKDWESFEGSYVDKNTWIEYLVTGFQPQPAKKTLFEPMYYALKDNGAEAAIAKYHDLKKNDPDKYGFTEEELVVMAYKLYTHEKNPEAIKFFDLCTHEFPEGTYTGRCFDYMGRAYEAQGDKELALKSYKACLELIPDRAYALERVAELTKQ